MQKIELTADVVRVTDPFVFASGSQKTELHLTWMEQGKEGETYEQVVALECWGQKIEAAKALNQGDTVRVECYLRGKEYDRKDGSGKAVFNSLTVSRIEVIEKAAKVSLKQQVMQKAIERNEEANDLPF